MMRAWAGTTRGGDHLARLAMPYLSSTCSRWSRSHECECSGRSQWRWRRAAHDESYAGSLPRAYNLLYPQSKEVPQRRKMISVSHAGALGADLFERDSPISCEDDCEEVVLGIDPDRSGAIAVLKSTRSLRDGSIHVNAEVIDVPVHRVTLGKTSKSRERIDAVQVAELVKHLNFPVDRTVAFLEGGGVTYHFSSYSAFVQGLGVGIWEGILSHAGIPVHKVNSKTWKTLFGLVGTKATPAKVRAHARPKIRESLNPYPTTPSGANKTN